MELKLFEHNRLAYEAAVNLMDETGKAAVIHPTGTGKSFIAFQLALHHSAEQILWLAPSEYIFQTQKENLKKTASIEEKELENIQFLTYSKLMMNEQLMETIHADYIILDEFHRCGATEWGKSVKKLLNHFPNAKLLGLSATNIRYLDGQRDMAVELFEGAVASEMTLAEAIAKNILPAPTYVISMYSYQEELKKLEKRISDEKNSVKQKENEVLLEKLRRALEQAEGLDQVFARHMSPNRGKYIVFCSGKDHMEEMLSHVKEWFRFVDETPHVYAVYYDNPETSTAFTKFKSDESQHLRLLFCIDMLNEGVHVEDIDGVILLRPTVSPLIYLQQIGRALSAGGKKSPLIFDIVNNFDSLYTIDALRNQTEEVFAQISQEEEMKVAFQDYFRIYDMLRDCREIFAQLNRNLSASWETYYWAAYAFYQKEGHLRVPKSYVTDSGLTLGMWMQTQRRVKNGSISGNLTEEKIERLNAIGMEWENGSIRNWNRGCEALRQYREQYGNTEVKARYTTEDGYALGKWVSNIRAKQKKAALTKEQQEELEAIGMIWDKRDYMWKKNFKEAEYYFKSNGNLNIPYNFVTVDGIRLGVWLESQKNIYAGTKSGAVPLTAIQIEKLESIGIHWFYK